jgi:hypothetical protein
MGLDIEGINIQDLNTETGPGDTDTWFDEEKQTFARQDGSDPESPEEVEAAAQPRRQSLREYSTMELVA